MQYRITERQPDDPPRRPSREEDLGVALGMRSVILILLAFAAVYFLSNLVWKEFHPDLICTKSHKEMQPERTEIVWFPGLGRHVPNKVPAREIEVCDEWSEARP